MRAFKLVPGILLVSLGLLWSLQGADLIQLKPILCFANCEPLVGGSVTWLITGIIAVAVGIFLLARLRNKR